MTNPFSALAQNVDISRVCVEFGTKLALEDVPLQVVEKAKKCLLDWLGSSMHASQSVEAGIVRDYSSIVGGECQASVLGAHRRTSVFNAALCNGFIGHILEFDDVDKESISHPAAVVMPAALAIAEWQGSKGKSLLTAIIAGYEVMLRIGAAITPAHYRIWHTTSTAGVFGSTIAAGRLIGLSAERMGWAFGSAGTMASGLWQFLQDGAMSKYLHTGKAAANGVMAAILAQRGLTGANRILEGEQGFFAGYARQEIVPALFSDFYTRYRTDRVSFKPYPCCRHTHSSVDCALALRAKANLQVDQIKAIQLTTYDAALRVAGNRTAENPRRAKFSLVYCVAQAFVFGRLTQESFDVQRLDDPAVRALMGLIELHRDEAIDRATPKQWPARMRVSLSDGRDLAIEVLHPKGDPENPLSWDEIEGKFRVLTEEKLGSTRVSRIITMCKNLHDVESCSSILEEMKYYY